MASFYTLSPTQQLTFSVGALQDVEYIKASDATLGNTFFTLTLQKEMGLFEKYGWLVVFYN